MSVITIARMDLFFMTLQLYPSVTDETSERAGDAPARELLADHAFSPRQPAPAPMIRVEFRNCTVHVEQGLGTCSGHPSGFAGIPKTLLVWAVVDARRYR